MRVNADSKGKRKWIEDEQDIERSESPSKRRKREEDAKETPPPTSLPSSAQTSATAVPPAPATTTGGAPASSRSRFVSLPRIRGRSTLGVEQSYRNQRTPRNAHLPFRKPFKRSLGFGGKRIRFPSPGVRILPPLPSHFGHSGPTSASCSQYSASPSTATLDNSVSSVKADSSTSSQTTEPQVPAQVHTIKRAAADVEDDKADDALSSSAPSSSSV